MEIGVRMERKEVDVLPGMSYPWSSPIGNSNFLKSRSISSICFSKRSSELICCTKSRIDCVV